MRFAPALAVLVTGLALYCSRGVLDELLSPTGSVRVALLPPWQVLAGFIALAALGWLWLDGRAVPRRTATAVRIPVGPLVLPLFGLAALILPFLPWIDRAAPAVVMLGGPLRPVIWLVVLGQLAWTLWQRRLLTADRLQHLTVTQMTVGVAVVTCVASGLAASQLAGRGGLYPGGDEPHYLVIAQSLWRDGDLKIENNHQRRDYSEYFPVDLDPHYLTRGADGEIYSIHPIGLPVLMAPVYAAGGYFAVVGAIVLMAAVAAALMWRSVVRQTNGPGAATFGWAGIALTTSFLFNSFAVYPEIAAALAAVTALTLSVESRTRASTLRWLTVGVACAALPWLSTKYAPMSAALVAVAVLRIVSPEGLTWQTASRLMRPTWLATAALVVVPYALSLAGWFAFFYAVWGSPWPQSPYGQLVQTDLINLTFGAPGLFFDQEYGLLPYAPVFLFAGIGLWAMWRDGGEWRRQAIEIVVVFAGLVGTVGAFRIWWGGSAAPGRPITSGLLLLMLPLALAFRRAAAGSAERALQHLLLAASLGIAGLLLFAQNGFLIANGRDGTSTLLEYAAIGWPAWQAAPSFIYHEPLTAAAVCAIWIALVASALWVLRRVRAASPGAASLAAQAATLAVLAIGAWVLPAIPVSPAWPEANLGARVRLPLFDQFDATALPVAVTYRPLRIGGASTLLPRADLEVKPGDRSGPQLVRVLHNGRFTLPAGRYRITIEWTGARRGERLGLQIGRHGDAWREWVVDTQPGQPWTAEFDLPVDAIFVGLRGTPELERVTGRIAITAVSIMDEARRPRIPDVIGASTTGPAEVFYHDVNVFPEARGFWVRGSRATRVSFARGDNGPLILRVHSGTFPNRLRVAAAGWSEQRTLEPLQPQQIEIPAGTRRVVTVELSAETAYVPRDHDAASRDPRPLGTWIEVVAP